jgi:hypothetical protein
LCGKLERLSLGVWLIFINEAGVDNKYLVGKQQQKSFVVVGLRENIWFRRRALSILYGFVLDSLREKLYSPAAPDGVSGKIFEKQAVSS